MKYCRICHTEAHAIQLREFLVQRVLKDMGTEASILYDPRFGSAMKQASAGSTAASGGGAVASASGVKRPPKSEDAKQGGRKKAKKTRSGGKNQKKKAPRYVSINQCTVQNRKWVM